MDAASSDRALLESGALCEAAGFLWFEDLQ